MNRRSCLVLLLACRALTAMAQQNTPRVGYVYPAGGRQGSSFEITVGGQFLNGVRGALITGDGIRLSNIEYIKPVSADDAKKLRDRLNELLTKWHAANPRTNSPKGASVAPDAAASTWTDIDETELREIRVKLGQFQLRKTTPALAELVMIKVSIAQDAALGQHEFRLETPNGVTSPFNFYVGQLPEWTKPPAGTITHDQVNEQGQLRIKIDNPPPTPVVKVMAPVVINGQIAAGGVDSYQFKAHKGEHLVVAVSARELIPYIADAVPGWFQASLTLYDAKGKEMKYADHYSFHPDPALMFEIPEDGEYTIAIHDSIYRGREDFVYRVALGELPFVTGMFPLGGKVGGKTTVEFSGWNLSQTRQTVLSREDDKRIEVLAPGEVEFNARPFARDTLPETMAKLVNHSRKSAQKISLPLIVNGRVAKKAEWEFFQFKGKAGEEIEAEVYARRLDSPLDSVLTLMNADGKILAANDDFVDESAGLLTDQADSLIRYKLPSDGTYYLRLGDTLQNGGLAFSYRLRVSHPQPDFDLLVTPSSVNVRAGSTVPITVYALRHGGFTGDIALNLNNAPRGFQLNGGVIPGNQSHLPITLTVSQTDGIGSSNHLEMEGAATIGGKAVRHKAVPADDRMQAFFYHHQVATKDLLVTVNGQQKSWAAWSAMAGHPLTLVAGQAIALQFALPVALAAQMKFALMNPPDGITIERMTSPPDGNIVVYLKADGVKAKPGLRGNLLFTSILTRPAQGQGKASSQTQMLPAFSFEVLASTPHSSEGKQSAVSTPQDNRK